MGYQRLPAARLARTVEWPEGRAHRPRIGCRGCCNGIELIVWVLRATDVGAWDADPSTAVPVPDKGMVRSASAVVFETNGPCFGGRKDRDAEENLVRIAVGGNRFGPAASVPAVDDGVADAGRSVKVSSDRDYVVSRRCGYAEQRERVIGIPPEARRKRGAPGGSVPVPSERLPCAGVVGPPVANRPDVVGRHRGHPE